MAGSSLEAYNESRPRSLLDGGCMPLAVWSEVFATGIESIDTQHKNLFDAINRLGDCFKEKKTEAGASEALAFLSQYTQEHFLSEEEYMRVMNYPDITLHQQEHTALLSKVQNLIVKADEGYLITADIAIFAADWLVHHINETDMGYVRFIKDKTAELR